MPLNNNTGGGTTYTAGTGIDITGDVISGDYTAGDGVDITGNVIKGDYAAGDGVDITGNIISNTVVPKSGLYSALPAAGNDGKIYLPTDSPFLLRDTGLAWETWGPIRKLTLPILADFSWVNQGTATAVNTYGGIYLTAPASASDNYRLLIMNAPATPYTVLVRLIPSSKYYNTSVGLVFYQSSDGKFVALEHKGNGINKIEVNKWTNVTTWSANYTSQTTPFFAPYLYISDDGANRISGISFDGTTLFPLHSIGRTDFLTADRIGILTNSASANSAAVGHFISWEQS